MEKFHRQCIDSVAGYYSAQEGSASSKSNPGSSALGDLIQRRGSWIAQGGDGGVGGLEEGVGPGGSEEKGGESAHEEL
jgi:hypothetical protein